MEDKGLTSFYTFLQIHVDSPSHLLIYYEFLAKSTFAVYMITVVYSSQGPSKKQMAHPNWVIWEELNKGLFIKLWAKNKEATRDMGGHNVGTPLPLLGSQRT